MDTITKWDTVKAAANIVFIWLSFTIIRDGVRMHSDTGSAHIYAGACLMLGSGIALGITIGMAAWRNEINSRLQSGEWTLTENH